MTQQLTVNDLQKGMLVKFPTDNFLPHQRFWVVLPVTKQDIEQGVLVDKEGLCAFGGLWYGDDTYNIRNYGKVREFYDDETLIVSPDNVNSISLETLKKLVD